MQLQRTESLLKQVFIHLKAKRKLFYIALRTNCIIFYSILITSRVRVRFFGIVLTDAIVKILSFYYLGSNSLQLLLLNSFRHRMLVFVRTVRSYMNVTVIHSAWTEFCSSLHQLNSIESIYEKLVHYIKNINSRELINKENN